MKPASRRVVFSTRSSLFPNLFLEVLGRAGFKGDPVIVRPERLLDAVMGNPGCLVIIDGGSAPCWSRLVEIRQAAPDSPLVLCSRKITPDFLMAAFESGIQGVLSARLSVEDAVDALVRICNGEQQIRFDPPGTRVRYTRLAEMGRHPAPAKAATPDGFDALWMFECQQ